MAARRFLRPAEIVRADGLIWVLDADDLAGAMSSLRVIPDTSAAMPRRYPSGFQTVATSDVVDILIDACRSRESQAAPVRHHRRKTQGAQ